MSTVMTKAEREAFLKEPRIGVIAVNEPGRGPLAVPTWYDYEPGGNFWFNTHREARKARLIEVGVRVSLCVQDESTPYRYVSVEGPVTAIEPYDIDSDPRPMAERYLEKDAARTYMDTRRADGSYQGGIKVVVRPERWLTVDYGKSTWP